MHFGLKAASEFRGITAMFMQQASAQKPEFEGGGYIGIEVPSINSLQELQILIKISKELSIPVSQVNEVLGASLIPATELREMLHLAAEEGLGLTLSTTVRPEYEVDTAFYRTPWGKEQGRRISHPDKLKWACEETQHFIDMGCRGFIVYDIGLARLIHIERLKGNVPNSVVIKASTHCGVTNHMTALIHVENGIDDIIPMHDLSVEALVSIRKTVPNTALSIVTDTYATKGGFIRIFDIPKFIEHLCPFFLKMGNSVQHDPASGSSLDGLPQRLRRIRSILDAADASLQGVKWIHKRARLRAVPSVNSRSF